MPRSTAGPRPRCRGCRHAFDPTPKRPHHCADCHGRARARAYRKGYYRDVVKRSQVKLEAHRRNAREGMARREAARREGR